MNFNFSSVFPSSLYKDVRCQPPGDSGREVHVSKLTDCQGCDSFPRVLGPQDLGFQREMINVALEVYKNYIWGVIHTHSLALQCPA